MEPLRKVIGRLMDKLLPPERGAVADTGTPGPEAHELHLEGRRLLDQRTVEAYERSLRVFEEAITLDPSTPLPYAGLAEAFIKLNNIHRLTLEEARLGATRAAARALELGPSLPEAHVASGWLRWDFEDDLPSAEAAFRRAIELSPGHAHAHMMLAHLLEHTDRPQEALEEAERALRLDPMSASVRRGMVHFKVRLRDWSGVLELLKENVNLYPADAGAHSGYGYFLTCLGRLKEGSEQMRRALALDPTNPAIREMSAFVLVLQGEFERALGEAEKLIDGSPSDHDGHALTGEALVGLSRYEEAIAALNRAKEAIRAHDPEGDGNSQFIADIDCMLGIAYAGQGDTDRGEEVLRDLIERSETKPVARGTLARLCFALGKTDEGFTWLREACQRMERIVVVLRASPWLDDARSDPRFAEILETVGLADYPPGERDD
jgi:tetratricopeptide (TPR) repeat protein